MYLCEDKHDEICHEGHDCPACAKISELEDEIEELKRKIDSKDEEIASLSSEVDDLRSQIPA